MARTIKYLERKAMEAYADYSEFGDMDDCPFGYKEYFEPWAKDLFKRFMYKDREEDENCGVCKHFFKYKVICKTSNCPCYNVGEEKALAMLNRYVKKWRKDGLIK